MKMKQKILNNMVYIAVVAVLITTTLIGMFTYYRYMEQIKTGMKDEAAYLAASLNFEDQQNLDKYKNITITRITRIAKDGTVIYDSSGKEKSMGNHKNRTEVKEAFKHGHGEDTRMSMTLRKQTYYYALKLKDGTILPLRHPRRFRQEYGCKRCKPYHAPRPRLHGKRRTESHRGNALLILSPL